LGFLRRVHVGAGSCAKAGRHPETRHDCAVFLIASGPRSKNALTVLEFAALSNPYDDALSMRQEVTQLRWRPLS
jgi:hypothetical protein